LPKYDDASPFSNGRAMVKLDGRTLYIDKNEMEYDEPKK
jgi:hypothetical protein